MVPQVLTCEFIKGRTLAKIAAEADEGEEEGGGEVGEGEGGDAAEEVGEGAGGGRMGG